MKLNCKSGDLAMLIRDLHCHHNNEAKLVLRSGLIVKCVRLISDSDPTWELEAKLPVVAEFSCGCKFGANVTGIADEFLRPLPKLPDEEEELRLIDLSEPA